MGVKASLRTGGANTEFNAKFLATLIEQIGERASRAALSEMRKQTVVLRDLARSYAPVDKGNLEESIQILEDRGGANGRKRLFVYVDINRVTDGKAKTIGSYAYAMHESLAPYGSGYYRLGRKSRAKRAKGNKVGGKFMSRALRDRKGAILEAITLRVKGVL